MRETRSCLERTLEKNAEAEQKGAPAAEMPPCN